MQGIDLQTTKLFNLKKDPNETTNLILDNNYHNVKLSLIKSIKAERKYIFDLRKNKLIVANI